MKRNKGFTLIELLVVIAIIGILSAIVLASLSSARGKAQDAKIQSQLANMRGAAEIYFSSNGNKYATGAVSGCSTAGTIFQDESSGMKALVDGTASSTAVQCNATTTAWAVGATLISDPSQFWCVDSTGKSKGETAALGGATACN